MSPQTLKLAIVLVLAIAGLFGTGRQPSSGQVRQGWEPCGCFCGFEPPYPPVPPDPVVIFGDKNTCTGIIAADACKQGLANLSKDKLESICQKIKALPRFTSFQKTCPVFASFCEPSAKNPTKEKQPPEPKCEKPTPWFDSSSNCSDVQSPVIAVNQGGVNLSICSSLIFRWIPTDKDPLLLEAYPPALRDWVQERVGSKICCDKFREAASTGTPCNPRSDIDCDGKTNQTDVVSQSGAIFPDINNLFSTAQGAPIDPFPVGLNPDDPNFMPESTARNSKGVGECACKWELIKGDLKCSPDGQQQHVYTATWRCPSTKAEVFTTKYAPATAPCP
ncbi:MAG: hypothetical protein ABJB97_05150 [Acidobacteriota bacterium]